MGIISRWQQWLFRLQRDTSLPIVLGQRRIFIVPTRSGLLFAVVLAVMLIGAINYSLSLGHALIFLLAALALVAMIHTFNNLFGLQLMPGRADPVFAGDVALFPLQIEDTRRLARRMLEVSFARESVVVAHVPAGGCTTVAVPCRALHRGRLEPGRITLASRYPLGFFRAWSYPQPVISCLVYPKPIRTPLPPASVSVCAGQRDGRGGHEDFAGLRARQAGDPTRHVAWKAVARRTDEQPLLVKQFAGGAADELWLDWDLTPSPGAVEEKLSILAGWVITAEEQQVRYGLRLPGVHCAPACGQAHFASCLQALALFTPHAR